MSRWSFICFLCLAGSVFCQSPIDVSDELLGIAKGQRLGRGARSSTAGALLGKGPVAFVDIPLLVMLHPWMADFHPGVGSFTRPLPGGMTSSLVDVQGERRARTEAVEAATAAEKTTVSLQIRELDKKRNILRRKLKKDIALLRKNLATLTSAAGKNRNPSRNRGFYKRMSKLYAAFHDRLDKLDARQSQLEERLRVLDEKCVRFNFLTRDERDRRLAEIEAEIIAVLRRIVRKRGYSLVFNSGYLAGAATPDCPVRALPAPSGDSAFTTEYRRFLSDGTRLDDKRGARLAAERIDRWLEQRGRVLPVSCERMSLNNFVLLGAEDITPLVMDVLLRRHKVSPAKRDFLKKKLFR